MIKIIFSGERNCHTHFDLMKTRSNDALSSQPPRGGERKDHSERAQPLQRARVRQRVSPSDHGRRWPHAWRLLQLFREQERSLRRGARMLLHRSEMEESLG